MRKILLTLYIMAALVFVVSCETNVVYDTYRHVSLSGWERNDTLVFDFGPVKASGNYHEAIGLRINNSYPFKDLTLIVEHTVFPQKTVRCDTLRCGITDSRGIQSGDGISCYQYNFMLSDLRLEHGDSVHVSVRHYMRREILPGISDLGLIVER